MYHQPVIINQCCNNILYNIIALNIWFSIWNSFFPQRPNGLIFMASEFGPHGVDHTKLKSRSLPSFTTVGFMKSAFLTQNLNASFLLNMFLFYSCHKTYQLFLTSSRRLISPIQTRLMSSLIVFNLLSIYSMFHINLRYSDER